MGRAARARANADEAEAGAYAGAENGTESGADLGLSDEAVVVMEDAAVGNAVAESLADRADQTGNASSGAGSTSALRVQSRSGRVFRRAGWAFDAAPRLVPLDQLTAEQAAAIRAEPALVVDEVELPATGA